MTLTPDELNALKEQIRAFPYSIEYFEQTGQKLGNFSRIPPEIIHELNYNVSDSRYNYLTYIQQTLGFGMISLEDYIRRLQDPEPTSRMFRADKDETISFLNNLEIIKRSTFLTSHAFAVENLINTILTEFQNSGDLPPSWIIHKQGYYKKSKKLFELVYDDYDKSKFHTFLILTDIRNLLHTNGINRKYKIERTVGGTEYVLDVGETINFAGWEDICTFLDLFYKTLKELLNHPRVISLSRINRRDA